MLSRKFSPTVNIFSSHLKAHYKPIDCPITIQSSSTVQLGYKQLKTRQITGASWKMKKIFSLAFLISFCAVISLGDDITIESDKWVTVWVHFKLRLLEIQLRLLKKSFRWNFFRRQNVRLTFEWLLFNFWPFEVVATVCTLKIESKITFLCHVKLINLTQT